MNHFTYFEEEDVHEDDFSVYSGADLAKMDEDDIKWSTVTDEAFWDRYRHFFWKEGHTTARGAKLKPGDPLIGQRKYSEADIAEMRLKGRAAEEESIRYIADVRERVGLATLGAQGLGDIKPDLTNRYLIKGLIRQNSSCLIFGLPGAAKSFLAIDLAMHIAAGRPWFGKRVNGGAAVYVAAEGQEGVKMRIAAWKRAHGASDDLPFRLVSRPLDLLHPSEHLEQLGRLLAAMDKKHGWVSSLTIDTQNATFGGGDENGADMARYNANLEALCKPYFCSRTVVTHVPVTGDGKRPRGHGSQLASADTAILVQGDNSSPARRVSVVKQKDDAVGPDIFFKLKPVEIGIDQDGDPVTSCIIEQSIPEPVELVTRHRMTPSEKIAKGALDRLLEAHGISPPVEIPVDLEPSDRVVRLSEWRNVATPLLSTPDIKPDSARRKFDRVRDDLKSAEILEFWEDWVWLRT